MNSAKPFSSSGEPAASDDPQIQSLSAITLATRDMSRAVAFYGALGFPMKFGGPQEAFTSFEFGGSYLNLIVDTRAPVNWWGRVIIYVSDVDALYRKALAAGLKPSLEPSDAPWGERYFHLTDPDGHEISFARPLR
ncbi:Glyoxalase/Bleomycin resistance protein/Dioxygenase superfamily protein [Paraburkholderia fungorum]|uniref:Glyoxalase/Bleomycin resistance protein/Dioxygenase superfamily protein n=1 Tax=Paraburkholderia fungorum TaxID=134537 RepID=A0A1H1INJ9_9BURK|nr:VOC family protein [Paraburkholderia fungorum]SDR38926.1 Glyoxalase/Bleomycin resistance protein/Dioxygenase superfamily protein [Paraburkholderia fungorum]